MSLLFLGECPMVLPTAGQGKAWWDWPLPSISSRPLIRSSGSSELLSPLGRASTALGSKLREDKSGPKNPAPRSLCPPSPIAR